MVRACFAGTTSWSSPWLTWAHRLDLVTGAEDRGEMTWDGESLMERGVATFPGIDGPVPYVERWTRLPGDRPVRSRLVEGGVSVRAGRHSLAIVPTAPGVLTATYRCLTPAGWRVERQVEARVRPA